jgi:hypothetical protein
VLDVMSMNDLDIIRMPEPVNANPLRICSHREQFFDERTAISTILQHFSLMTGNQKQCKRQGLRRLGGCRWETRPKLRRWPLPPLWPKRAACGVAGLRSGSGQRKTNHALMSGTSAGNPKFACHVSIQKFLEKPARTTKRVLKVRVAQIHRWQLNLCKTNSRRSGYTAEFQYEKRDCPRREPTILLPLSNVVPKAQSAREQVFYAPLTLSDKQPNPHLSLRPLQRRS